MEIKVSVIIPVYKTEQFIHKCVDSVLAQTFQKLEIILVDDGSPDQCAEICDAYAVKDNRIKVIHKKNGGLMSAWIAGTEISNGDYLFYVDSDDWIDCDMVEQMMAHATECKAEMICCNYLLERRGNSIPHAHVLEPGEYKGAELQKKVKNHILGREQRLISMSRCMKLFSRKLIINNIHYCDKQISMGEDMNITLPAVLDSERIVIMRNAYYYHYLFHEASIVHTYNDKMYDNNKLLYQIIRKIMSDKEIEQYEILSRLEYDILLTIVIRNELRGNPQYVKSIQKICKENREIIRLADVKYQNTANKMIDYALRHPNTLYIMLLQKLIKLYDRYH